MTKEDGIRADMRDLAGWIDEDPVGAHRSLNGGVRLAFWVGTAFGCAVTLLVTAAVLLLKG